MKDYPKLIEDTEFLLGDKTKEREASSKKLTNLNAKNKKLNEQLLAIREQEEAKTNEIRANQDQINRTKAAIRLSEDERKSLESDLVALKGESQISELQSKQKPFWDALESRMIHQIETLDDGLEGITTPKDASEVCKKMRSLADGMNFSQEANAIRNIQSVYAQTILTLCEMSVDGKQILPEHKQERLNVLDRFLMTKQIAPMWSN